MTNTVYAVFIIDETSKTLNQLFSSEQDALAREEELRQYFEQKGWSGCVVHIEALEVK